MIVQTNLVSQSEDNKNQYLYISAGQGFVDGIIWLNWFPTIGIGYEMELNRFFGLNLNVYSYYRKYPDSYFTDDANGYPIMDIIVENAWGPFITEEDRKKIQNVGIKDFDPGWTIKEYSLPVTLNLNFNVIKYRGHNLGVTGGIGFCYVNTNYSKDFAPVMKITLNDNSVYEVDVVLSQGTEFRSIDPFSEHLALYYEYKTTDYKFGIKFGNYGYFYGNYGAYNWDSSFYIKLKI